MSFTKPLYYNFIDIWTITKRNLYRYLRLPQLLFFSSIQPIVFLLLFNYVFGGAIGAQTHLPGDKYINYLLPGILIQTTLFGGLQTGIGLAEDMGKGVIDRFRSLPMSRLAVIAGRTFSDAIRNTIVMGIMLVVGMLLGFRFQSGFESAVGMILLILLFGYAFSWIFGYVGMTVKDTESAQMAGFVFIFPLVFASSVFVPIQTLPEWLQVFVRNQPITFIANAARELALGVSSGGAPLKALLWSLLLLIIFIPLGIWQYKRRSI